MQYRRGLHTGIVHVADRLDRGDLLRQGLLQRSIVAHQEVHAGDNLETIVCWPLGLLSRERTVRNRRHSAESPWGWVLVE